MTSPRDVCALPDSPAGTPGSEGPAEPNDVADLIMHFVKRMRRLVDARLSEHGLTMSRIKVLGLIGYRGPTHQGAIATIFELAPRTVTELIDGLERDGLVARTPDPADRRARFVDLTAAGRDVLAIAVTARNEIIAEVFGSLEPSQLNVLAQILRRLDDRVIVATGPESTPPSGGSRRP